MSVTLKDKYFAISETARELNVTRQTISRWIKQGRLSAERIGRETLITKREVQRLQHERVHESLVVYLAGYFQQQPEYKKVVGLKPAKGNLRFSAVSSHGNREILQVPIATIKMVKGESGIYHLKFTVTKPEKMVDKQVTDRNSPNKNEERDQVKK